MLIYFALYVNFGISRLLSNGHKAGFDGFKKFSEVAPQTSLDIAFGPLSEMLGNHWFWACFFLDCYCGNFKTCCFQSDQVYCHCHVWHAASAAVSLHLLLFCECCSRCKFQPYDCVIIRLVEYIQSADNVVHGLSLATVTGR